VRSLGISAHKRVAPSVAGFYLNSLLSLCRDSNNALMSAYLQMTPTFPKVRLVNVGLPPGKSWFVSAQPRTRIERILLMSTPCTRFRKQRNRVPAALDFCLKTQAVNQTSLRLRNGCGDRGKAIPARDEHTIGR